MRLSGNYRSNRRNLCFELNSNKLKVLSGNDINRELYNEAMIALRNERHGAPMEEGMVCAAMKR